MSDQLIDESMLITGWCKDSPDDVVLFYTNVYTHNMNIYGKVANSKILPEDPNVDECITVWDASGLIVIGQVHPYDVVEVVIPVPV